ncbi:MAG: hypothetical protein ACYSTS_08865 [Planctomycetota bacterium]
MPVISRTPPCQNAVACPDDLVGRGAGERINPVGQEKLILHLLIKCSYVHLK